MNKVINYIAILFVITILSCEKSTTNPSHNIMIKCFGKGQNTIEYSFGDTDVTYVGTFATSWTIVRDVRAGKTIKLKQTASVPKTNAATVLISDNGNQVAYAQNDTTTSVSYTVK